ncbi:FUSC family protein [Gandjariella thermophila]|uniref:Membrane protein n=1 Tax=Gandjariella thermophila TaxID=1931992 RepID=A0A4D4JDE0_9PSEU|nr:FUSC family protein [Gandjariella thermophila]GDY33422.1 membrane protein [Gandjariella thermophila]
MSTPPPDGADPSRPVQGVAAPAREAASPAAAERGGEDLAAPHWLVQMLRPRPAPIEWNRVVRAALAIGGPIAVGMLAGALPIGVLVSIGALPITVTDRAGPYRYRLRRSGFVLLTATAGYTVGSLVGERGLLTAAAIVVLAVVSAVISAANNTASMAGLQLLVFGVIGAGQAASVPPGLRIACFVAGAAWAVLLALSGWPVRATAPERAAVARVFDAVTALLRAIGTGETVAARRSLTAAMNDAYDALLSVRSRIAGRDLPYRRLLLLLSEATPLVEASVALAHAGRRPPPAVVGAVAEIADAVRTDGPVPRPWLPETRTPSTSALVAGVQQVLRVMSGSGVDRVTVERPSPRERFESWWDSVVAGPETWFHALRLALCMVVAEALIALLHLQRPYWVLLTVAIVLKPDFGSVFARALLRGGGTLLGVLVGAAILAAAPGGWLLAAFLALFAAALPIGQVRNYGMFSTLITPLVIIQLDLAQAGDWSLVLARLLDTLLGCLVVLVVGYLLWPGGRRPRVGGRVAEVLDLLAEYLRRGLGGDPRGRSTLRRRSYRALSDLRTAFQQLLSEPSAAGRLAAAWWPAIVRLERVTDAVTRVAVEVERGAPVPDPGQVERLAGAVGEAAAAVRAQRAPGQVRLPDSEQLAGVSAELTAVLRTLRGPEWDGRPPPSPMRLFPTDAWRRMRPNRRHG